VTLRQETEWIELVEHGYNHVVGSNPTRIVNAVSRMLDAALSFDQSLYGRGSAGTEIVSIIAKTCGLDVENK
jgi:UDP-GlcNAc3NAcA epimerase